MILDYLGGSKVIAKVLKRRERGRSVRTRERKEMTKAEVKAMRHEKDSTGPDA